MRVKFGWLLLLIATGFYNKIYAQTNSAAISGKVLNEKQMPEEAVTVLLLKAADSAIVKSTITGKNGAFQFISFTPGRYILLVRAVGYNKLYTAPYMLSAGQALIADDIILNPGEKQLKEVQVTSSKPDIEIKPGKIILNIQNSILADGNSAFDILKQSPGVRVDNNNVISVAGRQSALIMIDSKSTNLPAEDLANVLKGLQANTIDRIELITGGSAKYDASGAGIINIIMKKGKNVGFNAAVNATAGYGTYYKSNAGLVFNDRTDKFNIFGSYTFTDNKTFHNFTSYRSINYDNILSDYDVDYHATEKINNNNFRIGTDYFVSPGHTIGFLVNGSVEEDNYIKQDNLNIYNQSVLDSTIAANSLVNRHISRMNYNINYNGKLDKEGKTISADLNYSVYNRGSSEYITNQFYNQSGNVYRPDSLLQNLSPSNIRNWLAQSDFTDPISKNLKFEAGLKYSKTISDNNLIFGPLVNGQYESDPRFSNHFIYTENVNAAYINFQNKVDKFEIVTGLRAEQTISEGNSVTSGGTVNNNYTDLFPQVLLTWHYNEKSDFSLSFNRGIQRPPYVNLNPFLYYTDLYDYTAGNQYLKPQYTNTIELSYGYNGSFLTTLYNIVTSGAYDFPVYMQNDTSKVNITNHENFGTIYNYGIRFSGPVVFTNWWNADINVDASYQRYVAYPMYGNLNKGSQDIILSVTQHFIISETISAEIFGRYESPSFYGVNQFKSYYWANAAISKQLFNKRGSLKLNAADIFDTKRDRAFTNYQNLNLVNIDKVESQIVKLTFTYRFGKVTVKAASSHAAKNEDEQKRMTSGN